MTMMRAALAEKLGDTGLPVPGIAFVETSPSPGRNPSRHRAGTAFIK